MEINLERGDLLQIDPISHKGTVRLLPPGKKHRQKLLTGDDSGTLACYEFKKGEPQTVFTARPFEGPITSVAIGGSYDKRDKVFASHSQRIVGYTKKGKEFFKLTSSLTETILNIKVDDTKIWTGCEYIYNLYDNGQDTAFFMCPHQINSLITERVVSDNVVDVLLGCQDSCIRIIQGSTLVRQIPCVAPVTSIASIPLGRNDHGFITIAYGTETGAFGAINLTKTGSQNQWLQNDGVDKSPINCICVHDLLRDGNEALIVGRNDGRVEVYLQHADPLLGDSDGPMKVFSREIGESIRSVECGAVNVAEHNEIVIASYSGKVLSYTTEEILKKAQDDKLGRTTHSVNTENRMKALMAEIDAMQAKMEKDKAQYRKTQGNIAPGMPPPADFPVNATFVLDPDIAAYVLTVEIQNPIDLLILRSPVPLDLVDSKLQSGSTVVSVVPQPMLATQAQAQSHLQPTNSSNNATSQADAGSKFVATYRCQNKEKRIAVTMRTTEGEAGDLQIVVVANSAPKAAKVLTFPLKPLSLHSKIHQLTAEEAARPKSSVRFTGNIMIGTIHDWVQAVLPDVPPRLAENELECTLYFRNAFTGGTITVDYRRNEILFESDSASAVAIAKEMISKMATNRRIHLEEELVSKEESIECFLSLIRGKLEHLLSLARKVEIVDAILEISQQDSEGMSWLSGEYAEILKSQDTIKQEFKDRSRALEYLTGIVTDLFVDWHRLRGVEARHRIPQLQQVILANDFGALLQQFIKPGK